MGANRCRYHVVNCCEDRGIKTCADCQEYLQLETAFLEKEDNLRK